MKRTSTAALIATILAYLTLIYVPFQRHVFWGIDEGEYIAMTKNIVSRGLILSDYSGWTQGYPYFQGYFAFTAAFSSVSGISVHYSMWALVFSSFISIIFIFLIAERFLGTRAAILSAAFLALIMPFAYQNSHPAPESLGHVLLIGTILAFWTIEKRTANLRILPHLLGLALIITHPMSSYFLLLALAFMYLRRLYRGEERSALVYFLMEYAAFLLLYWAWPAYPFIGPSTGIPQYVFSIGILAMPALLLLEVLIKPRGKGKLRIPGIRKQAFPIIVGTVITIVVIAYMLIFSVPGTEEPIEPYAIAFYLPLILLSMLSFSGVSFMAFHETGRDNRTILAAIGASALIGWLTGSDMLIPFRHMEYAVIPMALMFGIGTTMLMLRMKPASSKVLAAGIGALFVASALTCYPPPAALQNFTESTDWNEVPGALAASGLDGNIATDHRLSSVLRSFGQKNVSWENAGVFFENPNSSEYPAEYVFITDRMSEHAIFSWKEKPRRIDAGDFESMYLLYSDKNARIYLFTRAGS